MTNKLLKKRVVVEPCFVRLSGGDVNYHPHEGGIITIKSTRLKSLVGKIVKVYIYKEGQK